MLSTFQIPKFITIEGGEGAGKSSLLPSLVQWLEGKGYSVLPTCEPGGSTLGIEIRKWLLSPAPEGRIGAKSELLLFLAARADHIEKVIQPALDRGIIVICDRFNDSTIAYQGAGRSLGMEWVQQLCEKVTFPLVPDLTFYLDILPEIGLERTRSARKQEAAEGELDRIEAEALHFHKKVREAFLEIVHTHPARCVCIDANQPQENVFERVKRVIEERGCV